MRKMCRVNTGAPQCGKQIAWAGRLAQASSIWTHMDEQERADTVHDSIIRVDDSDMMKQHPAHRR